MVKIRDRGPGGLSGRRARARKLAGGARPTGFEGDRDSSNEHHPAAGKRSGEGVRPAGVCTRLQHAEAWERKEATPWRVVEVDTLLDRDTMGNTWNRDGESVTASLPLTGGEGFGVPPNVPMSHRNL